MAVFTKRIIASSDDAEEVISNGDVIIISTDLEMHDDPVQLSGYTGMRWTGVTIPQGATITNATIQFTVDEVLSNSAVTVTFRGEDIDDAPTFTTGNSNISNRTETTASVNWVIPSWLVVGDELPAQLTPDLSSIVQEIVDRGGWVSGNDLVIMIKAFPVNTGQRTAEAFDGVQASAPELSITYTEAPTKQFTVDAILLGQDVTFIGKSADVTENDNSGTSITVNFTSHKSGDLLIAFINCSNGTPNLNPSATINAQAGWTEISDISTGALTANGLYLAYHIATSDDEIPTQVFTSSASTGYVSSGLVFRGVDQTTPIDVSALGSAQVASLSNTTPSVTTTVDNVFVVRALSLDENLAVATTPSPSGYVNRFTMQETGPGNGTTSFWYDMVEPTAGATGTEVISWTASTEENISAVFGIRPQQFVEKEFTVDGKLIQDGITFGFTVDSRLIIQQTETFTIDSQLVRNNTFTIDSLLKKTQTKTFTIDALTPFLDQEKTFTVDAKLVYIENFNVDAIILKVQTDTFTVDAIAKKTQTKIFTVDARLSGIEEFIIDALIQAQGDDGSCGAIVQSGTVSFTGTTTDVTIPNPVVLANSFLTFQYNVDNNAVSQVLVRGQLTSTTNIHFERTTGGATVNLSWYVTESPSISAQRGSFVFSTTTENQTITSVDTTKSFSLASWEVAGSSWGDGDTIRHRLTSATNLEFLIDTLPGGFEPTVDWEVVEYTGAVVQRGIVTMTMEQTIKNITITSVDSSRTIVHLSNTINGAIAIPPDEQGITGELTTSTNLRIQRQDDSDERPMEIAWEVTEFPADVKVQSGSESLGTSQTVANVAITSVDLDSTAVLISHDMKGGRTMDSSDDNPHTIWYKAELTTTTNLQLTRASSDSSTGDVVWYVIEFPTSKQQECFDIDSILIKRKDFTVDAKVVAQTDKEFTIDSLIQKQNNDKTFTIDGCIQKIQTETFDVDAFIQKTQTETFDVDGLVQALNQEETFTIDAFVQATQTLDFTVDALLQATQTETFDIDALIQTLNQEETFTVDSILRATFDEDFTVDALIKALNQEETFTVDTLIEAENEKMFLVDGLAQATQTETFDVDSIVVNRFDEDFTVDAKVIVRRTKTFTIDGLTQRQNIDKTFLVDAFIQKTQTETFLVDAFVQTTQTKDFTVDAFIQKTQTETFTIDAFIQRLNIDKTFTVDAFVQRQNINEEFTVDGFPQATQTEEFLVDGFPQATFTFDFTIDSFVQKLDNDKTFLVDARIALRPVKTFEIDGLTQGANTKTFEIDALIEAEKTRMFLVDARIQATFDEDFIIDGLTKATQTETFTVDARIVKENTEVFDIDAFVQDTFDETFKVDGLIEDTTDKDFTIDSILLATQIETFLIDARIEQINTETFTVDSLLSKKQTTTYEVDAQIKQVQTKTFIVDSILANRKTFKIDAQLVRVKRFDIDAVLQATFTEDFLVDSVLKQGNQEFFLVDGFLVTVNTKDFTVDAVLAEVKTELFDIDSLVQKQDNDKTFIIDGLLPVTNVEEFDVDARVLATVDEDFEVDSFVLATQTKTFDIDAGIELEQTKTFIVDSLTLGTQTKSFTVDTFSQELKNTKDFTVDARIRLTKTETFTIDARVRNTFDKDFAVDGQLFAVLTFDETFEVDSMLRATQVKTFTIDGIPVIPTSRIFCIDALLQANNNDKTFSVNAKIVNVNTEDFTIDAQIIPIATNTEVFTVDAFIQILEQTFNFSVDTFTEELNQTSFTVGAILLRELTINFTVDSIVTGAQTKTFIVDAQIFLPTLANFTVDGLLVQPVSLLEFTVDAKVQAPFTEDFLVDGITFVFPSKLICIDGLTLGTQTKDFTIDADLRNIKTTTFDVDALILLSGDILCAVTGDVFVDDISSNAGWTVTQTTFPPQQVFVDDPSFPGVIRLECFLSRLYTDAQAVKSLGSSILSKKDLTWDFDHRHGQGCTGFLTNTLFSLSATDTIDNDIFQGSLRYRTISSVGSGTARAELRDSTGTIVVTAQFALTPNVTRFVRISIVSGGTLLRFEVFSDSARTNLVSSIPDVDITSVNSELLSFIQVSPIGGGGSARRARAEFDNIRVNTGRCPIFLVDSVLRGEIEKEFTVDAVIVKLGSFTVDAILKQLGALQPFTIDAFIGLPKKQFLVDAILSTQGKFTIDAFLVDVNSKEFDVDSIVKSLNTEKTFSIDAEITRGKIFLVDSILKLTADEVFTVDTILSGIEEFDIDGRLITRFGEEFLVDGSTLGTVEKDFTIDGILIVFPSGVILIDAIIQAQDNDKTFTIDSQLFKAGTDFDFTVDAFILRTGDQLCDPSQITSFPDVTEDFSTYTNQTEADTAWVPSDIGTAQVDITNDLLGVIQVNDTSNDAVVFDLQTALGEPIDGQKWVLRYKLVINSVTNTVSGALFNEGFFGITTSTGDSQATQTSIGINIRTSVNSSVSQFRSNRSFGTGIYPMIPGGNFNVQKPVPGTYYIEQKRTGSLNSQHRIFSDENYTNLLDQANFSLGTGIGNMRFLAYKNRSNSNISPGETDFTIDDIQFWNGISDVSISSCPRFNVDAIIQTPDIDKEFIVDAVIKLSGENGICNFFPSTNLVIDTGLEQFIGPIQPFHEFGVEQLIGQEVTLSNQQVRSVTILLRSSNFPNEITANMPINAEVWSDVVVGNFGGETTEAVSDTVINAINTSGDLPPGDWTEVKFTFDINTTPFLTGNFVVGYRSLSSVFNPAGVGTALPVISNSNVIPGSAVHRKGANSVGGDLDEWGLLAGDQKDIVIQLEVLNGDDIILGEGNQCPLVDAILSNLPDEFLVDAKLTNRFESEFSVDTILFPFPKPFSIDAVLVGTQLQFIIDSIIVPEPKTFTVDALILVVPGKLYNIDAVIFGEDTNKNFTVDSFIQAVSKPSPKFNINAFLFVRRTKDFTVDGSTKFFDKVAPFTIDALVIFFPSQLPTIDGMVKELGSLKPFFIDGLVQRLDFNFIRSIDALIVKEDIGKTFLVEGLIAQGDNEKEFTIDAKLGSPQAPFLFTVDAQILLENHRARIDALLQKSINKLFLADALIVALPQKLFLISGLTKGFDINKTFIIDGLLKAEPQKPFSIDARILQPNTGDHKVDAIIKGIGLTFGFTIDASLVRVEEFLVNGIIQALGDGETFTGNNGSTNANNSSDPFESQTTDDNTITLPIGTLVGQRLRLSTAPVRVTSYTFVIHRAGTAGTPTGTLTGKIYKNSIAGNTISGADLIVTSDNVVNLSSITTNTNGQNVTFTFTDPPEITVDDNVFIGFDIAGSNEQMFLHTESTGTVIDGGDVTVESSGTWGVDLGVDAVLTILIDTEQRQRASSLLSSFVGRFSPTFEVNALVKSIGGESGSYIPTEFTVSANIRFKRIEEFNVGAILIGSQDFTVSAFVGDTLFVGLEVESVIVENNSTNGVESVIVENNSDSGVESVIGQDT